MGDELRKMVADLIRRDGAAKTAREFGVGREPILAFALGVSTRGTDLQIEQNAKRRGSKAARS